ncbi:hypothetical protein KPL70_011358 [Citrus sinensis]|nr:hypothetical protein KPL70_011358 [Citrus sinensis]
MNCLQNLPRSSALPLQSFRFNQRKPTSSSSFNSLGTMNYAHLNRRITVKAITGSTSSKETSDSSEVKEEKSEIYSTNMTEAMGAGDKFVGEYIWTHNLDLIPNMLAVGYLCRSKFTNSVCLVNSSRRQSCPKPDTSVFGSKQKAATPPAGSGELPSTSSSKPKEWSCALCQVTATTEREIVHQEMKPNLEEESVGAKKTVVGLDQKVEGGQTLQVKPSSNLCGTNQNAAAPPAGSGELPSTNSTKTEQWSCALCQVSATTQRGLDEHLQGRKHKAKVAGLLRDKKMCNNSTSSTSKISTESRDGVGQELKTKVQEEPVKANKTVVGLNQKVEGGLDEHPQGKKQKAKEEELLGAQKDSAGQEIKATVEKESVKANKTAVVLEQKVEGGQDEHLRECGGEEDSENKNEELPKKKALNAITQKTTNGIPTGGTMRRKLPLRENFEFWCEVFQVGTQSAVVMEGHKRGKKHMARSNGSRKNNEAVPLTTRTTIVTPSEPTENVEDEDAVAQE